MTMTDRPLYKELRRVSLDYWSDSNEPGQPGSRYTTPTPGAPTDAQ